MNQIKKVSRLGIAVAGAAALMSFGMASPAQAAGATGGCPGGAYCATPTQTSGNGYGNAAAHANENGLPDAGTVGNADNMNPPGQAPNGTDSNAGYECDTNGGVGQTNPAHTGCSPY
jgi:hypothetical protein